MFSAASFRVLGAACVLLALSGSAWGFWSAFHPGMTPVEVSLENLPDSWRDKTIVQLSDVHLGHFHTAAAMGRLAERVNALAPDMVVITGDLFDGMIDGLPGFAEPLKRLSARKGVYFVTGNHEVYAGLRRSLDVVARADIRVLFNEVVEIDGLHLMGVAYPGVADEREIRGVERLHPAGPRSPAMHPAVSYADRHSSRRDPGPPHGRILAAGHLFRPEQEAGRFAADLRPHSPRADLPVRPADALDLQRV